MTTISSLFLYFAVCWKHVRKAWFRAFIPKFGDHMQDWMKPDLELIHLSLRITTNIINLLLAVDRYFGGNNKYAKVKGA